MTRANLPAWLLILAGLGALLLAFDPPACGATLGVLGRPGGTEVRITRKAKAPLLLLLAGWAGCAAAAEPGAQSLLPPDYTRAQQEAGAIAQADAAGDVQTQNDFARPPELDTQGAPPPDVQPAEPPINVVAPLPPSSVAWLETVPACGAIQIRGYGRDAGVDRCEGRTRNGVRCVECVELATGAPLAAECESQGSCSTGESTRLVCVADCLTGCERQPRYCPPEVR